MKVYKENRVLEIQEIDLPHFLAKGYVQHVEKEQSTQQTTHKQVEKTKKLEQE